jgi:predicted nucleotidyltransferase
MKTLLTICFLALFSTAVYVSMPINDKSSDLGICVVEFNASFNASNSVDWLDKLSDCSGKRIDIVSEPNMQKEHKIVVVPTIIIFNEGEEVKRFQANIMMQLEASEQDVQEVIDEILMSSF